MDTQLLNLLQQTKLDSKQAKVYLALLQLGQGSVSEVARFAKIKRSNTYSILSELESLGLARPILGKKIKIFAAADPNKLIGEMKRGISDLEEMLPYLRSIQRRAGRPYVQHYSGIEGAKEAFSQIYRPKQARYLTSISSANNAIPLEVSRWQKTYLKGKARPGGKHILTNTAEDKSYANALKVGSQESKLLPEGMNIAIDIALVDDAVFLTTFEQNVYVTVIRSIALYEALSRLYDLAWTNFENNASR